MLRSTLVVTFFTVVGQAASFILYVLAAKLFGASSSMDAFLAAATVPQFLIAVILNALGTVFLPVFVQLRAEGREREAWDLANGLLGISLVVLTVTAALGVALAGPLLRLAIPGLDARVHALAVSTATFTWPMLLPVGVYTLLVGLFNAHGKFGLPAAAALVGGLSSILLLALLVPHFGVRGLAIAVTAGAVVQLVPLFAARDLARRLRHSKPWPNNREREVLKLLAPLVLSGFFIKWTPLVERYLASGLPPGSIARLGYASLLVIAVSRLLSTGLSTVLFPRMAAAATGPSEGRLRRRISFGLRAMWLGVAPFLAIGTVLAFAGVAVVFRRGGFTDADATAVAMLVRVYLLALLGMCLGTITGRGFYVLRMTGTLAMFGVAEAVAYAGYTVALTRAFGIVGLAVGYVLYFDLSLVWQLFVLRRKVGNVIDRKVLRAMGEIGLAALAGAAAAWIVTRMVHAPLLQVLIAGSAGVAAYVAALRAVGSPDAALLLVPIRRRLRRARTHG